MVSSVAFEANLFRWAASAKNAKSDFNTVQALDSVVDLYKYGCDLIFTNYCLDVVGRFETACKTYFKPEKATKCVNLAYPALEKFCKLTFFRSATACKNLTTTLAPTTTTTTTVIPKILPAAITDPTDSPSTAGFPIFPLIGVAFGIIFLVAVGISLFLFCRKQNKPSSGQKGPSKMEEGASKTASIESKSKSVVATPEKTGGDSKIEGKSEIGGKFKNGKSKIGGKSKVGGKPEKSMMKPRNDGRSAFMYTG